MKTNIVKYILVFFMFFVGSSVASATSAYEKVVKKLTSGDDVISLLHLDKCEVIEGKSTLNTSTVGGHRITEFLIIPSPKSYIAYANKHFTITPDGTPIVEFVQYRVKSDDDATVTVNKLSPVTYEKLMPTTVLKCRLGAGLEIKS